MHINRLHTYTTLLRMYLLTLRTHPVTSRMQVLTSRMQVFALPGLLFLSQAQINGLAAQVYFSSGRVCVSQAGVQILFTRSIH